MPSVSGTDLISQTTDKTIRRTTIVAAVAILVKLYNVPVEDSAVLNVKLPGSLIDTSLFVVVVYSAYTLLVNWLGDLLAFRMWYRESSIWSQFGTNMKLDKDFISGGIPLLQRLHALEKAQSWPVDYRSLDNDTKNQFQDFKTNVELFSVRLEHAGTRFRTLSAYGHYYVWIHSFVLPMALCVVAVFLLVTRGSVALPVTR